jgi:DNA-binding response OmpR family regulator
MPDDQPIGRRRHTELHFRPGDMPAIFGDTAAALVVDDDEDMAQVLMRMLSTEGYRCTWAATGAEARAFLGEGQYALALVDVVMPDETGLELVDWMLAEQEDIAVVMVTGLDDPLIAELALESGVHGYVVKPFQRSQLLITVASAGRQRCLQIERRLYNERLDRRQADPDG